MNPPPDPTPPVPPPSESRPQYEFDAEQNAVIDSLAASMVWVGVPLAFLAVVYAVTAFAHVFRAYRDPLAIVSALAAVIGCVFFFLLARWARRSAAAFTRVTHTAGYDVTHLMAGLRNLARFFGLVAAVVQVYLMFLLVMLIFFVGVGLFGWFKG